MSEISPQELLSVFFKKYSGKKYPSPVPLSQDFALITSSAWIAPSQDVFAALP